MPRRLVRRFFSLRWLTLFSCGWLLVVWALENWIGETTSFTALLTYLPQHGWAILPFGLLLASLLKRRPKMAALNTLALLLWAKFLFGLCLPLGAARVSDAQTVRIMTFNVAQGKFGLAKIEACIQAQHPDILCLEESQTSNSEVSAPNDELLQRLPGWKIERVGDVLMMSRFPLLSTCNYWQRQGSTRRILEGIYQTPRGKLRVLTVHVSTNFKGSGYAHDPMRTEVGEIVRHARDAAQARLEQIRTIDRAIQGGNQILPFVMVGDFNTPPRGRFYRHWQSQFTDAFAQSGLGTGASFPSKLPVLRIDYAWLGNGVRAKRAFVVTGDASDHLPLIVDVVLP